MSDGWRLRVERQGHEALPVVVIDDFATAPERFIDDAAFLAFAPMGEHYPGVRARVPDSLFRPLLDALRPTIVRVFGPGEPAVIDAFYSLVTTPPAALTPIQRMPHIDEASPTRLALLHFLSHDETSGTAFFRHRTTGWESLDGARLPVYRAALAADLARHGVPAPGYITGDTPLFEEVARHAGRFNRALLYRSNALHCAAIPDGMTLPVDPEAGRLTVNTFVDLG